MHVVGLSDPLRRGGPTRTAARWPRVSRPEPQTPAARDVSDGVAQAKADTLFSQPLTTSPQTQAGYISNGPTSGVAPAFRVEIADDFTLKRSMDIRVRRDHEPVQLQERPAIHLSWVVGGDRLLTYRV